MRPIDLIPRETRASRSGRAGAVVAVLVLVGFIGLLATGVVWWETRLDDARADLARQQAVNQQLEREIAAMSDAVAIRADYDRRADFVRGALAVDVDWGLMLNDLSRFIPPRVWVTTFSASVGGVAAEGALGRVAVSGVGFDFDDVAEWLRSLDAAQFRGVTGPWVSTIVRTTIGDSAAVDFSSTAVLSPDAAARRIDRMIPEVP